LESIPGPHKRLKIRALLTVFDLFFAGAMFMYFLVDYQPFVETVGFLAVFTGQFPA
jgi:hypothetical protein